MRFVSSWNTLARVASTRDGSTRGGSPLTMLCSRSNAEASFPHHAPLIANLRPRLGGCEFAPELAPALATREVRCEHRDNPQQLRNQKCVLQLDPHPRRRQE